MVEALGRRRIGFGSRAAALLLALSLLAVAPRAGADNRALSCDGTDDFAIAPITPSLQTSTITIELWARPAAFTSLTAIASATSNYGLGANLPGAGAFTIGPGTTVTAAGGSITLGEWVHIAGTYDGTTVRVFVNGQPEGSILKPDHASLDLADTKVCVWPGGGTFFQGAVDELRVWDHVRTDQEIADHYTESLSGQEPGLVAYYQFDEPSGQTIVDGSPNGRDGTLGADASAAADDPARIEPGAPVPEPSGGALVALLTAARLSRRHRLHA
jgi:hypothetical protein